MGDWVAVATMRELVRHRRLRVDLGGEAVALFLHEGQVYALRDTCLHKQRSLAKGTVWQGKVVCPGHQWSFDLATGYVEDQDRCQPTYAVRVEDDQVYVHPQARVLVPDQPS